MSNDVELFKKSLGKQVARLRNERGFTQAELGALINKDYQSISRIESGKINSSCYIIFQIAKALDVDIGEFFVMD